MTEQYTLTYNPSTINFRPLNVLEEIFQNINTVLGTTKFTVPLDRAFGLNATFVDDPMTTIHPHMVAEVIETVEKYEDRVIVEEVKLIANIDGKLYPTVIFTPKNGVLL